MYEGFHVNVSDSEVNMYVLVIRNNNTKSGQDVLTKCQQKINKRFGETMPIGALAKPSFLTLDVRCLTVQQHR